MRQILGWAEGRSIESMVYTSSTSVYPQDGGVWVDESADVSEASETGKLLIEAERMLESNGGQFGSWYVLRLSGIYGPGRHHLLKQLKEGDGVIPGRGDYHMNMVHLADIVQAIVCAISGTAPSGVYNISDDHPAKKEQVLAYLAEQLNLPQPTFAPELVSPRLRRRGGRMPDRLITNQKAKDQLGWSPSYPSYRDGYASIFSSSPF
jgi:nucleoside-diphosphate-sugar epimerase